MKDLDRNEVYDLRGAREEQLVELIEWLGKQQGSWVGYPVVNLQRADYIRCCSGWWCHGTEEEPTIHISTLFEEDFVLPEKWCIRGCEEFKNWVLGYKNNKANIAGGDEYLYYYTTDPNYLDWDWRDGWYGRTEITFEQFEKYVLNKKEIMEKPKLTITRQALSEIFSHVCPTWQDNIKTILDGGLFNDEFEVPQNLIDRAYNEADGKQIEWLKKYFPQPQPEKMKLIGSFDMYRGLLDTNEVKVSEYNTSDFNLVYSTPNFDIIEEVTIEGDKQLYIGKYNEGRI